MKKIVMIFFFIMLSLTFSEESKKVLILHSYSNDYLWTRKIQNGLYRGFNLYTNKVNFSIEYMDTKNIDGELYGKAYKNLFDIKYSNKSFDLIIAVDDNAVNFILKNKYFEDTPLIAAGLNSYLKNYASRKNIYMIFEKPEYKKTLNLALKQNPNAKKIYIVNDNTTTGRKVKSEIVNIIQNYEMEVQWLENLKLDQLKEKVKNVHEDDILYYLLYFKGKGKKRYKYDEVITELSRVSHVPLYVSWDFYFGKGAFGGKIFSAEKLGENIAGIAEEIFEGKRIERFILDRNVNIYMFDYDIIKKYGYENVYYPEGTVFINKPETYYEKNHAVMLGVSSLTIIIVFLIFFYYYNSRINRKRKESFLKLLNAKNEIIDMQKDVMLRLGDMVESRSENVGDHVRRVGEIAVFIGKELNFSKHRLEILEAASPLHDIGKIGINDHILKKPGKLTEEEYTKIKQHTDIGYSILKGSRKEFLDAAAIIAFQHHERWDGAGYPNGLKDKEIHIYARITAVADVIDSLLSEKIYKKAWEFNEVMEFIEKEKGKMFDPEIVDIVLDNRYEIYELRQK